MQFPRICPGYQIGVYNITIYDNNNGDIIHSFRPMELMQKNTEEQALITKEVKSGLTLGRQYVAEVTVESIGMVRNQNKTFGKLPR